MTDWQKCSEVERHPEKLSGAWVFRGTRVPVATLFENIRDGASVEQFLDWFPGVGAASVEAVLDFEVRSLAEESPPDSSVDAATAIPSR